MLPVVFNEKMFDDLFDSDFFGGRNPLYGRHAKNLMKTDIREKEDGYEMAVDLPGFNKDEIKVEINVMSAHAAALSMSEISSLRM